VTEHAVPLGEPDRHPGALDGIGVLDRRFRKLRRYRARKLARLACMFDLAGKRSNGLIVEHFEASLPLRDSAPHAAHHSMGWYGHPGNSA
jgi:hypothetical protein